MKTTLHLDYIQRLGVYEEIRSEYNKEATR